MRNIIAVLCNIGLVASSANQNSTVSPVSTNGTVEKSSNTSEFVAIEKIAPLAGGDTVLTQFAPEAPVTLLSLESTVKVKAAESGPTLIDGTEYGESVEHLGPRAKHFLRKSEVPETFDKDRKSTQSSLDVDETEQMLEGAMKEGLEGLRESMDYVVSAIETLPSHPAVKRMEAQVDNWAQETKAGFMGYWKRIESLWKSESKSVGNKLFEAADAYSHRFFTLLHVKESEHPVLAAKVTRIIVAMGLSLTLVFVIFGLALQLQKSIIAKAHEEAGKQEPRLRPADDGREQLFFAMPYPQTSANGNIVVVE